jgi:L-2,4-diaminobutyrate decarboxylase
MAGGRISDILAELRDTVLVRGYCNGAHPQYFGYFHPRPLPAAFLGDTIAALLNQSPAAWRMGAGAAVVEHEALCWLADFTGYGRGNASGKPPGIFTSGGTTANLAALKIARDTALGRRIQQDGLLATAWRRPTVYGSSESHYSISRALDTLGLGRTALRPIPVDGNGRASAAALRTMVGADLEDGCLPLCAIGLAGTSSTGAVDPLDEFADVARQYNMWFHVDGAAGAAFAGLPATRTAFRGIDRADSLTIDPHKWLFLPYGIGCLLVRDSTELAESFNGAAHYWQDEESPDTLFMSPEGSRPWKSLALWLTMRQLGHVGYAELLGHNLEVARHLADGVRSRPGFELLQEPTCPVCCFRVLPDRADMDVDRFNECLQQTLLDGGQHYVTVCRPGGGSVYLRVSINNYSTQPRHVEALLDALDGARMTATRLVDLLG